MRWRWRPIVMMMICTVFSHYTEHMLNYEKCYNFQYRFHYILNRQFVRYRELISLPYKLLLHTHKMEVQFRFFFVQLNGTDMKFPFILRCSFEKITWIIQKWQCAYHSEIYSKLKCTYTWYESEYVCSTCQNAAHTVTGKRKVKRLLREEGEKFIYSLLFLIQSIHALRQIRLLKF